MVVWVPFSSVKRPCRFGEEIHASTVCSCVPVLVLMAAHQRPLVHFFSRAEHSLSTALLHDLRAALSLQIHTQQTIAGTNMTLFFPCRTLIVPWFTPTVRDKEEKSSGDKWWSYLDVKVCSSKAWCVEKYSCWTACSKHNSWPGTSETFFIFPSPWNRVTVVAPSCIK